MDSDPDAVNTLMEPASPLHRPRSAADAASEYLRRLIFEGALRPGDRIHQSKVAAALKVSRQPVGVALIRLEADGLVDIRPRKGVYVKAFDEDAVRDNYELMGLLQGWGASRVAERSDPATLRRLAALVDAMEAVSSTAELDELAWSFYRIINQAAGSARLRELLRGLDRLLPGRFFERFPEIAQFGRSGAQELLAALEHGDSEGAERTVREMWRRGGDLVVEELRSRGHFPTPPSVDPWSF